MTNHIADTIREQIGGNRTMKMLGAHNILRHDDALSLKIGAGGRSPQGKAVNYMKVTLLPCDFYSIEFGYIRGLNYTVRTTVDLIEASQLRECIERNTGLYTRLF